MRPRRYTLEQYADALRRAAGNRRAAAALLGRDRDSVDAAIRRHPELKAWCAPRPPRPGSAQHYRPDEVAAALRQAGGNQERAARLLGCGKNTVAAYIRRYAEVKAAYEDRPARSKSAEEVVAALRQAKGNRRRAGQLLGVSYTTIYNYIRRYPAAREACAELDQARREGRLGPGEGDEPPAKARTGRERYSLKQVAEALRRSGGIKAHAARMLHCSRQAIDGYIKRHPEVREVWIDARETMVDIAETKLHAAVERGEWRAVRFTLSTLGRDRGYSTKPVPLQDPFAGEDDDAAFRRVLDKVYGKRDPETESGPTPGDDLEEEEI
jgi:predicted transcriptional regulator